MKENGRKLSSIQFYSMLGDESDDYLYSCLKQHEDLEIIKFNNLSLSILDAKAISKVLVDFKNIKELNLKNC